MPATEFDDLVRLSYFSGISKDMVSETTVKGVIDRLTEDIGACFSPLNCSLLVLDSARGQLAFKSVFGKAQAKLMDARIPASEGIAGWVVSNASGMLVEDASSDDRWSASLDGLTGFKSESIVAVPLKADDSAFGAIVLINKPDGGHFSAPEFRALSAIAEFAAIAIERAVSVSRLRRMATDDSLTGLLNRRGLDSVLERERSRLKRYGGTLAFILADIDGLKAINDERGRAAGDIVLQAVADALLVSSRECDAVARYGGDEFLVAMVCDDPDEAVLARERFAFEIARAAGSCPAGTFSVSLSLRSGDGSDLGLLSRDSDRGALKREGGLAGQGFGERLLAMLDDGAPDGYPS